MESRPQFGDEEGKAYRQREREEEHEAEPDPPRPDPGEWEVMEPAGRLHVRQAPAPAEELHGAVHRASVVRRRKRARAPALRAPP